MHASNKNETTPQLRITEKDTSKYTGMSRSFLRIARMRGKGGPPYIKIGRAVRYDIRDLDQWLADRRVDE
jgi:predicted DNA-binding transcriptional regulator AlpA